MTRPGWVFTPPAIADALTPLTVTTTVAQASDTSYTGATMYGPAHANFRYIGCGNLSFGAAFPDTLFYASASRYPNTRDSQTGVTVEFKFTGTEFQVLYKYISAAASKIHIWIDGQAVTARPAAFGGTTAGSRHRLTVNLGTSGTRTVRLMGNSLPFGGVWIQSGDTLAASAAPRMRMVFQGDSLVAGSNMSSASFLRRFARYVGADDAWPQALGGTGFLTDSTTTAIGNRTALDVVGWNPDAVLLWGGYNDVPANSSTAVAAAAGDVLDDIAAMTDPPPVILVGAWEPAATASSTHIALDSAMRELAISKGVMFVSPITGEVINDAGRTVALTGKWVDSSNVGLVIGSDGIHPTDVGTDLIAQQLYAALRALVPISVPTQYVHLRERSGPATE